MSDPPVPDQQRGPRSPEPHDALGEDNFLARTVAGWDAAFWAMLAIGVIIMLTAGLSGGDLAVALVLVGVLGGAYALIGRPAIRTRDTLPRHAYRIVLVVVVAALVYLQPEASFLLFIGFPQIWVFSERIREGAVYTVLLIGGLVVAEMIRSNWSGEVFLDNLPWWSISALVSLVFGMWVS